MTTSNAPKDEGGGSFDDDYVPPAEPFEPMEPDAPGQGYSRPSRDGKGRGGRDNYKSSAPRYDDFRQPPHDKEAEMGVLGAMLLSPNTVTDVIEELSPEDFFFPAHELIYAAVLDLYALDKNIDPVIVAGRLDRNNDLERVGGAPYLHTLISSVPTAANARYYAEIVAEKAVLRRLVDAGTRVVQYGYEGADGAEVEDVVDRAQQEIFAVAQNRTSEDYKILNELLTDAMDELAAYQRDKGKAMGVPTGFADLDNLINGLHGGQMIIIAARPGVGKSTIALDFMRSASIQHGLTSIIFSLEMSASEIIMRMLSAETAIKLTDMRSGKMDEPAWEKLTKRLNEIQDAPLYIDDSANLTMMEIRSKARRLKQTQGLDLVVLDYLQLMSSGKRVESRQQEVSEFSRHLKLLAKELDVPVIAISQLNRGPENRPDKKPQLADLRESGSLEQDADIVMLLNRPDSQERDSERAGEADIIIAKHRGGPIDTIPVAHQLHYSRFVSMAHG